MEFLDPGVRSRGGVEADPRQAQRTCRLLGRRVACHGTSMLTLTFHVCVELKRNLHRNKFGNWFLQFLGVQQEPPFTSTSQSTVTPRHPTTLFSKSNSTNPQQGLDRGRAIPRRKGMNKKDSRTLSQNNTTKTGGSVRSAPPLPLLRYERRCILQDGRTGWRISQLSRPEKDEYPRSTQSQENAQRQHERLNATRTAFAQPAQTKHPVEIYLSVDALNENTSSLDSVPQDGHTV